jgi:Lipid A 3-O-deacylase (PagL)
MRARDAYHFWSIIPLLLLLALPLHARAALASLAGIQKGCLDLLPIARESRCHSFELDPDLPATSEDPNGAKIAVDAPGSPFNFEPVCADADRRWLSSSREGQMPSSVPQQAVPDGKTAPPADSVKASSALIAEHHEPVDRNLDIYYRNRREFSLDVGWHPVNIPFIYDFAVGDSYDMTPLKYTLVPIVASLRWHVTNVGWKWIFRGNMDFTFSGSVTAIPRGPETHYYSFDFGIRRNFVYRNWKVVPFFEQRGGAGIINAKEPLGVLFAQGQNLTFTYNLGVGARYNLNSKYSFSAGMNYMHISNGYLSQPQFYNYGINVYGPMFGFDMRLGKPRQHPSE